MYTLPIRLFCPCWLTRQEIPAAASPRFPIRTRLISHSTLYLSHLSSFVLVSFIISAVNTSAVGEAQCEVAALKEFHSNMRCAYLKNLTYCHAEWRIKWKWHWILISCLLAGSPVTSDDPVSSKLLTVRLNKPFKLAFFSGFQKGFVEFRSLKKGYKTQCHTAASVKVQNNKIKIKCKRN